MTFKEKEYIRKFVSCIEGNLEPNLPAWIHDSFNANKSKLLELLSNGDSKNSKFHTLVKDRIIILKDVFRCINIEESR